MAIASFLEKHPKAGPKALQCEVNDFHHVMPYTCPSFLDDKLLGKLLHLNSPERKGLALNFKQKVRTSFPSWEVQTLPYYFCTPITKHQTGRTVRLVFPFFSNITIVHYSVYIIHIYI